MRDIGKASRRPRRIARATGTAASQGFRAQGRAASRMARDAPHRHATHSLPKTLGSRLYESILRTFGMTSGGGASRILKPAALALGVKTARTESRDSSLGRTT